MHRSRRFVPSLIESLETRRLLANLMGLDASGFQFDMNWVDVKADGYTFAYEKAVQGNYYTNPYYTYNMTQAKANGIPIGSYDFADFTVDPTTSANFFWNEIKSTISGDGLTLEPMLDAESYNPKGINLDSWVATWSSVLKADASAAGDTIQPVIYSDSSFADDYFSTSTSNNFPLWIAEPGSTAPTNSHTAPWNSWEIWQFGETVAIPTTDGEGSVKGDADQLNGDATELRNITVGTGKFPPSSTVETNTSVTAFQNPGAGTTHSVAASTQGTVLTTPVFFNNAWYFDVSFTNGVSGWVNQTSLLAVAGPPAAPVNSSPANNSTLYAPPTLSWNNDPTAASYNVFINNSEVASGLTTTSYTTTSVTAGAYSWHIQAVNSAGTTNSTSWSYTLSAPTTPTNSAPTSGSTVFSTPTLTWSSATGATSYNVFLNSTQVASGLTTTSYTPTTLSNGTYNWFIQAQNSIGKTSGSASSFTIALSTPTVSFPGQAPSIGASVFDFAITYTNPSNPSAQVNTATFGNGNITVTGPGGYSQNATFISQSQPGNGANRSATYEISAPNSAWNALANGTFTITINANQVADVGGGFAAAGTVGTFAVNEPFAYLRNNQVVINAIPTNLSVSWSQSGSNWTASNGASSIQFSASGFTSVDFVGTSGNDSLSINSPISVPLFFNGGSGQDTLNLSVGVLTLASDVSTTTAALTLNVSGTGQVNINSNQHLAGLNLSGNAVALFAAGANIAVDTQNLSIGDSAYVDIADDALVVESGDPATIAAYLASGNDTGLWDGPGINSRVAATTLGHSIGFAPATNLSYSSINGINFSNTAIVIRYTYLGDANLDDTVNADDLSLMMLAMAQQQSQSLQGSGSSTQPPASVYWYNGDFNYDSQVNQDDFLLMSLGSAVQNQQVLT